MTLYSILPVHCLLNRLVNIFYFIAQCSKKPSVQSSIARLSPGLGTRALTGSCIYQCISVSAHIKIFGETRSGQSLLMSTLILFVLIIIIQGNTHTQNIHIKT